MTNRQVFGVALTQQLKFYEQRHTLPDAPVEVKEQFRGLAHAAITAVSRAWSVPQAQVDDWIDLLKQNGYSWNTMGQLAECSQSHLVDLQHNELAVGGVEQGARLQALAGEFGDLLGRVSHTQSAANPRRPGSSVRAGDQVAERAERRQVMLTPILERKRWTLGRLATEAAVSKNSVYEYFDGKRAKISQENRQAMADALEIPVEDLPE